MSCEAELARLHAAQAAWTHAKANAASICGAYGHNSDECAGAQGAADDYFGQIQEAQQAYQDCLTMNPPPPPPRLLETTGHVTFLLVVEPETRYGGGSSNVIDADVIFKLDSRPEKSFGFQLRDDGFQPVRRGMLALLRDAIVHNLRVITDYFEEATPPNQNSIVLRVALTNLPQAGGDHQAHP